MGQYSTNRFQDFFEEEKYTLLKNYLYSYLLRKMAVENSLRYEGLDLILEVGSGISPVMTKSGRIIYSDLSFTGLNILRQSHGKGFYVVADGMNLPFKPGSFSHVICSEVLEHLDNDRRALSEISRVVKSLGRLIITFPHRKIYFADDDRFVNHYRRYETFEMINRLKQAGFKPLEIRKVLGPLEKITMWATIFFILKLQNFNIFGETTKPAESKQKPFFIYLFKWINRIHMGFVWMDAKIMPGALSTVKLIKAQKSGILRH